MSVSKDDIIAAYRAILGREPENEKVVESHTRSGSLETLLKTFVQSEEFASRMRFIYDKYGSTAAPEKPLRRGELGAWEEAARRYRAAVDREPNDGDAWMKYGSALKELKQFELAESAYRRAIELKNGRAEIYIRLGDVLNHLNRRDEAQKAYVAAYRLDPNSRAAATRLRGLPPEVASSAFDMDRLLESDQEADDPSPVRGTARRELMSALGLPSRPLAENLTLAVKRPGEPRLFPQTAQALALISTRNFLPFARLAAQSFRVHHPEFEVFLLLVDGKEGDASDFGEGHVVGLSELDISRIGWYAAKFTASEFANALKPSFLKYLSRFVEKVIYLDCDIAVFSRLTELIEAMDTCDVVLVPHMFTPVPKPEHYHTHPNRCDVFNSGLINAGCFAVNLGKAKEFIEFWENALLEPSAFFDEAGNQTDQQYLNWALIRVNNTGIVRDDRYNVAYWNLHERDLRVSTEGRKRQFKVDGKPLGFFHFSGYDIYDRLTLSKHDGRNEVYNFPAVAEILSWYSDQILASPLAGLVEEPYPYDKLGNGFRLSPFVRRLLKKYERFVPKTALESVGGADALCAFLMDPLPATGSLLPLVLAEIYDSRPDLRGQWPGAHTIAPDDLRWWFCRHAGEEYRIQFLIDHFRRSLVSDSSFGFAKQVSTALGNSRLQFFGADRTAAARRLRVAGESGMAEMLLETRAEWVYFSEMSAAFVIYDHRPDIQSLFPDICGDDLEAFSDWLDQRAPEIHACPPGMGERLRRCGQGASLARVYSFLARREDVARRSQDSLLSDDPEPVLRELIRACGDGMELDLDDVIVLRHIHKWSRHLLVPLYLELPLVRERSESSRVAGRNIAALPETVRRAPWALRGADAHAACFDQFEGRLDDEIRRSDLQPPTRPREVAELLRATWRQRHRSVATSEPWTAIQRLASAEFFSPDFASRLKERERQPGVNVFGFFASDIGVGESSRGLARAISLLRPVNPVPTCTGQLREGTELTSLFQRFDYLTDTNVFVSYPHRAEDLLGRMRPEHLAGRRNVAHLAWEQKDANPWWKVVYDRYDEIWAISDFAATAFRDMFPGRVRVVPNVLNLDEFPAFPEAMEARLSSEQINFLFVFDANSSIERKNPEGVIEAFERAFKDTSHATHVRLTLKIGGMHRPDHADRVEQLMRRAAASGLAIAFDGRQLSRDGLLRMIAEADCYVSLHRAEGFGYTMAEAMLYGVPVIASGYSGNLEYMTAKNSFLVPCKEAYVKAADGPFQRGSIWGEPDLDVAAELMRRAAEDRATFREVGKRGQETVIQALGANSIAETIRPFFDATQATSTVHADGGGATGEDGQSGVVSRRGDAKPTVRSGRRRVLQ